MEDKNFPDLGRQISDAVQDALRTGNFANLKQTIDTTMNAVVDKTISHVANAAQSLEDAVKNSMAPPPKKEPPLRKEPPAKPPAVPYGKMQSPYRRPSLPKNNLMRYRASSQKAKGVGLIALGSIGGMAVGIPALTMLLVGLSEGLRPGAFLMTVVALLAVTALFCFSLSSGMVLYKQGKRFKHYGQLLEGKESYEIDLLASQLKKSSNFVRKEIAKLIAQGQLPHVYFNDEKTYLLLNEDAYQKYRRKQEEARLLQIQEEEQRKDPDGLAAVIAQGANSILQIRRAREALAGQEIAAKLLQLEEVATKIFAHVEQRPQKLPEIRKFMSYYLPTAVKLVNTYHEFEQQPLQGDNIITAKGEILGILGTINSAFANLLDGLYQDDAMDVYSDISVLKTMLAQEGLMDNDFK